MTTESSRATRADADRAITRGITDACAELGFKVTINTCYVHTLRILDQSLAVSKKFKDRMHHQPMMLTDFKMLHFIPYPFSVLFDACLDLFRRWWRKA